MPTRRAGIVLVIPAHNEQDSIVASLDSVDAQTRTPDRVVVMADNCTDDTIAVVKKHDPRREVWQSVNNTEKKAGALNQAWARLQVDYADEDFFLVMDADTELAPDFVENAQRAAVTRADVGGVCATFYGKAGGGVLGFMQRLEYARFARSLNRKKGITFVLSGTATLFAFGVLRRLERERGYLYDSSALIEDYELSLALRTRGYVVYAPKNVQVTTDVMPGVKTLWQQRIRWQRGTLHELRRYGWNRVTMPDIARQFLLAGSTLARALFLVLLGVTLLSVGGLDIQWKWTALSGIIAFERAVTVRSLGKKYVFAAAVLVLEELYGLFREAFFLRSAWLAFFGPAEWQWHKT
jgi:biofilm PGA synthesis N-glycosyltransferase PgaC